MHLGDIQPFVSLGKKTSAKMKNSEKKADRDRRAPDYAIPAMRHLR